KFVKHRYIELFLQSEPDHFRPEGMGPFGGPPGPGQFGRCGASGRPFMPDSDAGYGGVGPDRGFGSDRGFGPGSGPSRVFGGEPDREFDGGYDGGSPGSVPSQGFGMGSGGSRDRDFGFNSVKPYSQTSSDRGFGGGQSDRNFGTGAATTDRGFGGSPVDRGYGRSTADRSGYGSSGSDRGFASVTGGPVRSTYATNDRFVASERRMDDRSYNMTDTYRNGMQGNSMGAVSMRNDTGYNKDRTNESEFYGSGKLFGDNSYQSSSGQGINMMGPTIYPGY
ncbi:heterogeneous nuclear ribonucleoprotein F, partial [Nephila pilipes]